MKESFCFVKVKIVTISPSHQKQSIWYCQNIILPLQVGSLISMRLILRTELRRAEVFEIQPENDVCNSYGIDSVWGLGDKVQSSSWLLEKYLNIAE